MNGMLPCMCSKFFGGSVVTSKHNSLPLGLMLTFISCLQERSVAPHFDEIWMHFSSSPYSSRHRLSNWNVGVTSFQLGGHDVEIPTWAWRRFNWEGVTLKSQRGRDVRKLDFDCFRLIIYRGKFEVIYFRVEFLGADVINNDNESKSSLLFLK